MMRNEFASFLYFLRIICFNFNQKIERGLFMKIAIVGSGNGAVTAAVDMVSKGHDVKLYCRNQSISKFQNAIERADLILIMKVMNVS